MNRLDKLRESFLWYSFKRDKVAIASLIVLMVLVLTAIFAPLIAPYNPYDPEMIDIMNSEIPPVWEEEGVSEFQLGTDSQGRDMLSTMIYGMRISIIIGLGAVIRGSTPHFDYVAGECAAGITRVALDTGIPVTFGVLTTDNIEQALERAGTGEGNKGFDVTVVALEMVQAMRQVDRHHSGEAG